MTNKDHSTPEEEALGDLLEKSRELLSEPGLTVLNEAGNLSFLTWMIHNVLLDPDEHDERVEKMRTAAKKITDRDRELLMEIVRAGKAAAASIDPDDMTPAWPRVTRACVGAHHDMASGLIEDTLEELEELEAYHKMAIAAMKELREELKEDG